MAHNPSAKTTRIDVKLKDVGVRKCHCAREGSNNGLEHEDVASMLALYFVGDPLDGVLQ